MIHTPMRFVQRHPVHREGVLDTGDAADTPGSKVLAFQGSPVRAIDCDFRREQCAIRRDFRSCGRGSSTPTKEYDVVTHV
jgi:hypothetical protein